MLLEQIYHFGAVERVYGFGHLRCVVARGNDQFGNIVSVKIVNPVIQYSSSTDCIAAL